MHLEDGGDDDNSVDAFPDLNSHELLDGELVEPVWRENPPEECVAPKPEVPATEATVSILILVLDSSRYPQSINLRRCFAEEPTEVFKRQYTC